MTGQVFCAVLFTEGDLEEVNECTSHAEAQAYVAGFFAGAGAYGGDGAYAVVIPGDEDELSEYERRHPEAVKRATNELRKSLEPSRCPSPTSSVGKEEP